METELKLLVDDKTRDALLRHPLLNADGARGPREQTLSDTYFDTPDRRLRHSDAGLRVRHAGRRWIQTMKAGGRANGGPHRRNEWESPVAGPAPELARLRPLVDDKKTRRQLLGAPALARRLEPVFTTRVKRTVWDLHLDSGDHIECAFDQGSLQCGDKKAPISELELELKSGDPAHLYDFALALQRDLPLRVGIHSKADRGYALLEPGAPAAVKATRLALTPAMTTEQAFQAIAVNCLAHMQANEHGVAETHDVESLHQMRVGMRRLRSALGMFKELLQAPEALQVELDWLARELGDARDWDVLSGTTLPALVKDMAEPAQVDGVREAALAKAEAHHVEAAGAVGSPRYTRLMLSVARWVHTMGWHEDAAATAKAGKRLMQPVMKFARQTLRRDQRRLRTRAKNLRAATPEARHRVRIAAKKTRYAAEFFGSLFKQKTVRPYIEGLTGLQDELGFLNDAAVAERLLGDVAAGQPQLQAGAAFARGFLAARVNSDGKKIVKLWKKFAPIPLPR
ncbi:MAG TPA: CHAD domain-containing protein [Telluria sp.]|nr:CHAD domain-containing protein [Telluria sp.]